MLRFIRISLAFFVLAFVAMSSAKAAGVPAGTMDLPGTAIQDITLLANTPFNPSNSDILLPRVSGIGTITIGYGAEDTTTDTIPILTFAGGMYYGFNSILGHYVFGNVAPLTGADFGGEITNVVQNPDGSFKSGLFTFGGASFGFKLLDVPGTPTLYTDPAVPFSFEANFNGLPPTTVTTLVNSGPDLLYAYLPGDPNPIATSSNRIIVIDAAVPEPSSVIMFALAGVLMVSLRRPRD